MLNYQNKKQTNKMIYSFFCDGGARGNPGPAATGFLVKNPQNKIIHQKGQFIGTATNNTAEYNAVASALLWLQKNISSLNPPTTFFNFYLDSKLVVNQLNGLYKIKNPNLRELIIKIRILENQINFPIKYNFINREKNQKADTLVNLALDNNLR